MYCLYDSCSDPNHSMIKRIHGSCDGEVRGVISQPGTVASRIKNVAYGNPNLQSSPTLGSDPVSECSSFQGRSVYFWCLRASRYGLVLGQQQWVTCSIPPHPSHLYLHSLYINTPD